MRYARWVAGFGLLVCVLAAQAQDELKKAEAAIEKLGGEPVHRGFDPKQPVFKVEFTKDEKFDDAKMKEALPHLKKLPELRVLQFRGRKLTDKGLAYLKELPGLEDLSFVGTGVTDKGLEHLKGMKKLQSVNLILTKVTDKGVADLKKALPEANVFNKIDQGK